MTGPRIKLWRVERRMVEGAHRPPLVLASDGHRYVLKLGSQDRDFPVSELIAAGLASHLGVPMPAYAVLEAEPNLLQLLESLGDDDARELLGALETSGGACFGSRLLPSPLTRWTPALHRALKLDDGVLAKVLAFDALIENGDRRNAHNPNLLVCNGAIWAIDHGQSLPAAQGCPPAPNRYPYTEHITWTILEESLTALTSAIPLVSELTEEAIAAAVSAVPDEWWAEPTRANRVVESLCARRHQVVEDLQHQLLWRR
ncbi:hypothetical protein L6R46_17330 [Myxococcota bacterium]|nr:hypothetical protein [Myxococcota bacterium]